MHKGHRRGKQSGLESKSAERNFQVKGPKRGLHSGFCEKRKTEGWRHTY